MNRIHTRQWQRAHTRHDGARNVAQKRTADHSLVFRQQWEPGLEKRATWDVGHPWLCVPVFAGQSKATYYRHPPARPGPSGQPAETCSPADGCCQARWQLWCSRSMYRYAFADAVAGLAVVQASQCIVPKSPGMLSAEHTASTVQVGEAETAAKAARRTSM